MRLALALFLLWLGCALLWVAFHGLDGETASFSGIWNTIGKTVRLSDTGDGGDD